MEFFLSPWMLWGAALGAAPIFIHLLNKRKFRETEWAAMQFLIRAVKKQSRRIRLEQLILLSLRVLILCLLAVALAEPYFRSLGTPFLADAPTHHILVVDSTFSMGFQQANRTRFQQAKDVARTIVEQSGQGDAFNLLRVSDLSPQLIVSKPSFRKDDVIDEISMLELPHTRGDVTQVLEQIRPLLEQQRGIPRQKRIYLISDFQRSGWQPEANARLSQLRSALGDIASDAQLALIDLGTSGHENSAITSFRCFQSQATLGRPVQFEAILQNFGRIPQSGRPLEFLIDGKLQASRRVDLVPGTSTSEVFTHTFTRSGEHRVEVRLQSDALDVDNRRRLSLPVREQWKVLCVSGSRTGELMGNATDYLELALRPAADSSAAASPFAPRVISSGDLLRQNLNDYDCVFLCNVPLFTPAEVRMLSSFLKSGGGIVWCLGDRIDVDNYNELLYRDGTGILPAKIGRRQGDADERESAFFFEPGDYRHPIVADFQGNPQAGLSNTLTYEYFQLIPPPRSPHQVALRFDTGDPAIIDATVRGEDQLGGGRSILIATSLDDHWGNWALWPSYLPMVREIAQLAASGRAGQREFPVNQPLRRAFPVRTFDVDITVIKPGGGSTPVQIEQSQDYSEFQFDETSISGFYQVNYGAPFSKTEYFAVNVDPAESDLLPLSHDELASELLLGVDFDYQTDYESESTPQVSTSTEEGSLARGLLYLVLYLLFVEQLMAWQFRYGLWLLCPPVGLYAAAKYALNR